MHLWTQQFQPARLRVVCHFVHGEHWRKGYVDFSQTLLPHAARRAREGRLHDAHDLFVVRRHTPVIVGAKARIVDQIFTANHARKPSPKFLRHRQVHGDAAAMPWGGMICALLAVLLFYVGLSGVWTFVETIAQASAIEAADSGRILSVATLLGIAGAASAAAIGKRWPRPQMLLLGYGLMVLSVLLWFGLPGIIRYAAGALIFKYTWTFVLPFVLACVADLDRNSRLINITNLVIGGGIAIGPALAGSMLEPGAVGMTGVLTLSAVCLAASLGLILGSRKLGQSHTATPIPSGASSS